MTNIMATATPRKARRRTLCHLVWANMAPKRDGLSSPGRSISIGVRRAKLAGGVAVTTDSTVAANARAGSVLAAGVLVDTTTGARAAWRGLIRRRWVADVIGRDCRKRLMLCLSTLTGPPSTGRIGGREASTFGTGCGFPKVVFDVWRGVCIPGRLYLNGSISCNNSSIYT